MDARFTAAHRGGEGPPLVLLHGFTGSWRIWELVLPALERRHDVLAPTLPGHAGHDLAVELARAHVRVVPAVGGDDAAVGLGGGVDDLEDRLALVLAAGPDRRHSAHCTGSPIPMSRALTYGLSQR